MPTPEENHGTFDRYSRARELAGAGRGRLGVDELWRILSDHAQPPAESICRHAAGEGVGQTYAALVICPEDRTLWTTFGYPCAGIHGVAGPTD